MPVAESALVPVEFPTLADDGDGASLLQSLDQSLRYYQRLDQALSIRFGDRLVSVASLKELLGETQKVLAEKGLTAEFFEWLKAHFAAMESRAGDQVLFTGYFEASLSGSRTQGQGFQYPLYKKPKDLVSFDPKPIFPGLECALPQRAAGRLTKDQTLVPYFTREEIDYGHKLSRQNLELVWLADPIEAFFLHIQGSGIVHLEDGENLRVNYAAQNGHPYHAIGKWFVEQGLASPKQVSMQYIKSYLRAHPEKVREILSLNPSYVFFREVSEGPLGNIQVPLTPLRSIATDSSLFPRGALAFIDGKPVRRLVLNQDTGGAIRGPDRVDLFTGNGQAAEDLAGPLQERGRVYFLVPNANTQ